MTSDSRGLTSGGRRRLNQISKIFSTQVDKGWDAEAREWLGQLVGHRDDLAVADMLDTWISANWRDLQAEAITELVVAELSPQDAAGAFQTSLEWADAVGVDSLARLVGEARDWDERLQLRVEYWVLDGAPIETLRELAKALNLRFPAPGAPGLLDVRMDLCHEILSHKSPKQLRDAWEHLPDSNSAPTSDMPQATEIRRWAQRQGLAIGNRGRLPADVVALWIAQHGISTTLRTTERPKAAPYLPRASRQ